MSDNAFNAAKRVLCCLHKQDIPEVEAAIRLLRPSLEDYWIALISEVLQEAEAQLDQFDDLLGTPTVDAVTRAAERDRERVLDSLILAILGALQRRIMAPPPRAVSALMRQATASLMADGARAAGESLDAARAPLLAQAAPEDLLTLLRGRLTLRREAVRALLRAFLTTRTLRTASPSGLNLAALQAAGGALQTRQAWRTALAVELGTATASWMPFVIDQWAYRWYNIGSFAAARQGGVLAFRASAVRDLRTSAFCRWVDGRVISAEKIQRQLDRHVEAAMAGDLNALMANWPLLTLKETDGPAEFELMFARVGLPPYHGRCRTRAVPFILV